MSFETMGLRPEILRAVQKKQYTAPTPIQSLVIPAILRGKDVIGCAQTGTGKTAGFTLPILQRIAAARPPVLRVLVLVPTRELASQVHDSIKTYGRYLSLRHTVVFGGVGFNPQKEALQRGSDILIATPGRLLDHINQGTVSLKDLQVLILDEADRMLDMGFIKDIRTIIRRLPAERQTLLFSATMPDEIEKLAREILKQPQYIEVSPQGTPATGVRQVVYPAEPGQKRDLLLHLIESEKMHRVLVFTRTKRRADQLATFLKRKGNRAEAIHGNKSQRDRTRTLEAFRNGSVHVLVATNLASRGLDVKRVSHVVNYEIPDIPEDYVHRIGRTARAEMTGDAISLVSSAERENLRSIERLIGSSIPQMATAGFGRQPQHLVRSSKRSFQSRWDPKRGKKSLRRGKITHPSGRVRRGAAAS